jgi:archaemetzincin
MSTKKPRETGTKLPRSPGKAHTRALRTVPRPEEPPREAGADSASPRVEHGGAKSHLGLVEMGRVGEFAVRVVAANIQAMMGIPVDILAPMEIPGEAFQHHRQQYDAGLVIKHLKESVSVEQSRILALLTADLCNPILTYVYGEAEIGGSIAVVSTFRLSQNEDGSPATKERYYERLAKVALHEVAHTFLLYHCEDPRCLMRFSPKVSALDQIVLAFCDRCEFMLRENVFKLYLRPPQPHP